jgi:hypothetical protein
LVDVHRPLRHDPEVGAGVVDEARRRPGETQEKAELDVDEHDRKDDPDDGDDQPHLIVDQVPQRQHAAHARKPV